MEYTLDQISEIEQGSNSESYLWQECKDEKINESFKQFHEYLVNSVLAFARANDIEIDEVHFIADGLRASIPYNEWQPCTDSSLEIIKDGKTFLISI